MGGEAIDRKKAFGDHHLAELSLDHEIKDEQGRVVGRFGLGRYVKPDTKRPEQDTALVVAFVVSADSPVPPESVHIYLDGNHNREIIYNQDDAHFVITPNGGVDLVQGYQVDRYYRDVITKQGEDGAWAGALALGWKIFTGNGVFTTLGPNVTYGFNIAIGSEEDAGQRIYWQGDSTTETDTGNFGSIAVA